MTLRRDHARLSLTSALLAWLPLDAARDVSGNVLFPIEEGDDPYEVMRQSTTLAKYLPDEAEREDAVRTAAGAWQRAMGRPRRLTQIEMFVLALAMGSTPREAAAALREETTDAG